MVYMTRDEFEKDLADCSCGWPYAAKRIRESYLALLDTVEAQANRILQLENASTSKPLPRKKQKLYGRSEWATVTCANEDCEKDIDVIFRPELKGKTYGPPENCYETEPAEIDTPEHCPHCGITITEEDVDKWLLEIEERDDE
jgi:hypothetical protein